MANDSQQIVATPDQVFAVLADGWTYASWVVGASHIRAVEAGWPAPGTKIHHSVGAWPLLIKDNTEVMESDPPRSILLNVRAWPLGHGHLRFTLVPEGGHTLVTMAEEPSGGPARWTHNLVAEALLGARNRETLRRLAQLVEGRAAVPGGATAARPAPR